MKVKIVDLKKSSSVKRFIDLPKLFDLLVSEKVFFPKIETLAQSDPFESGFIVGRRCRERSLKKLRRLAQNLSTYLPHDGFKCSESELREEYYDLVEKLSKTGLQNCILDMETRKFRQRIVCSCWYRGDEESDAMWKVYAGQWGVALVSTVGRLASSLKGRYSNVIASYDPQEYLIAPVCYVDKTQLSRLPHFYNDNPWLLKRKAFRHEEEIRISHELPEIVWSSKYQPGMFISVAPQKLIKGIVLSPFNPKWVNESLFMAISVILESRNLKIRIRSSEHMRPPSNANAPLQILQAQNALGTIGSRRKWKQSMESLKYRMSQRRSLAKN
jgi:hypothetical protein